MDPAAIDLDLHIKDVQALLESEGLERVILVGYAYAGMVMTGVAPRDGEAMVDQLDVVRGPDFTARVRAAIDNR